jgi:hypothetical protein
MSVSTKIEKVTPAIAEELLQNNPKNRKVSLTNVKRHTEAMRSGKWLFDGAPIRIATDGSLLDGQHRLMALIEANMPQNFVVVRGVESEAQYVMDTGKRRSLADALTLEGEVNTSFLASLVTASYKWDAGTRSSVLVLGGFGANTTPTIPQFMAFFKDNAEELREAVLQGIRLYSVVPVIPRVATLAAWLFTKIDADDSKEFFARLQDGVGLAADSPILALRERLFKMKESNTQKPYLTLALFVKAWNFYRDGVPTGNLKFTPGGRKPEEFPEPR